MVSKDKKEEKVVYSSLESAFSGVSDKYPQGNSGANSLYGAIGLIFIGGFMLIVTGGMAITISSIFIGIGVVLLVIACLNWGKPTPAGKYAYKRYLEKEELRKEQLRALRKGKVNVELEGGIKKLK